MGPPSTLITARSLDASAPTSFAVARVPSLNVTEMAVAPSTTWSLVTMWPWSSITKPEPWASVVPPWPCGPAAPDAREVTSISTTPAASAA